MATQTSTEDYWFGRCRQPGGGQNHYFELVILVILILIFIWVAARQIWKLRVNAERVAVAQTVSALRVGLGNEMLYRALHGGMDSVAKMDRTNPIDYLKFPPPNYEKLTSEVPPEEMQPYRWYYDTINKQLIYRVANNDNFETTLPGPARIRFQVRLHYDDKNGNGRFDAKDDIVTELTLDSLDDYHWRDEGSVEPAEPTNVSK